MSFVKKIDEVGQAHVQAGLDSVQPSIQGWTESSPAWTGFCPALVS